MANTVKKPIVDEEAHWRIDEQQRELADFKASIPSMESIQAAFGGMLAMHLEEVRRIVGNAPRSSDTELCMAVREMIELMKAPRKRTITAQLPSGPITVTTDTH